MACKYANVADFPLAGYIEGNVHQCEDGEVFTAEVGSYLPNDLGLHDMLGNVWEWTSSVYEPVYAGAEQVPFSGDFGNSTVFVFRGGSWFHPPENVRSARRMFGIPGYRTDGLGFRLVRDLD